MYYIIYLKFSFPPTHIPIARGTGLARVEISYPYPYPCKPAAKPVPITSSDGHLSCLNIGPCIDVALRPVPPTPSPPPPHLLWSVSLFLCFSSSFSLLQSAHPCPLACLLTHPQPLAVPRELHRFTKPAGFATGFSGVRVGVQNSVPQRNPYP